MVTVSRFTYLLDAQFAQLELGNYEIPSFIADENTTSLQWLYTNAIGGIRLQVHEDDLAEAVQVLAELNKKPSESITCSHCGSSHTESLRLSPWSFILYLLGVFMPIKSGRVVCNDCGKTTKLVKGRK